MGRWLIVISPARVTLALAARCVNGALRLCYIVDMIRSFRAAWAWWVILASATTLLACSSSSSTQKADGGGGAGGMSAGAAGHPATAGAAGGTSGSGGAAGGSASAGADGGLSDGAMNQTADGPADVHAPDALHEAGVAGSGAAGVVGTDGGAGAAGGKAGADGGAGVDGGKAGADGGKAGADGGAAGAGVDGGADGGKAGAAGGAAGAGTDGGSTGARDGGAAGTDGGADGAPVEEIYLKASNPDAGVEFGSALAISGDTIVVGAPDESSGGPLSTTGFALYSGAAYVFVRTGGVWSQQALLKASNADGTDEFGSSVAIDGDTLVVGAPYEDSNATGVGGAQSDNSDLNSGAAYVFVRAAGAWTQQAYLKANDTADQDMFGWSVGISGDTVVVSAPGHNNDAGSAYVFKRTGTTWAPQGRLLASNPDDFDSFGWSLGISGDTILVGAQQEASDATGVGGTQTDNSLAGAGAAYVFLRTGTTWAQQAYIKATNPGKNDGFGSSVALDGNTAVVSAPWESSKATGVGGNQADNSATNSGAVYVYTRTGTTWTPQAYVKATNTAANDFLANVAISGDALVVGAGNQSGDGVGVGAQPTTTGRSNSGAAYVYQRTGTTWAPTTYIKASNPNGQDVFGTSVGISSAGTIAVGAPGESSKATGVGGDQLDNSLSMSGAAYVIH